MNKFLYIFFLFLSFTFFSQEKDNIKTHTYATNNTPPTPEKLAFEATKLTASNSQNKKRIAKEGETLYYVNSEKKPKTDISLTINPALRRVNKLSTALRMSLTSQ